MIFLDFAKIDFNCPNCKKKYSDENEIYLKKINKLIKAHWRTVLHYPKPFGFLIKYNYNYEYE